MYVVGLTELGQTHGREAGRARVWALLAGPRALPGLKPNVAKERPSGGGPDRRVQPTGLRSNLQVQRPRIRVGLTGRVCRSGRFDM